jgi:CMP-N,N'-diacetyllegionaminic acid synthase
VTTLAVIPARGGSKAVPRKNVQPLAGQPLVAWSIGAARGARLVDRVIVSTDDEEIAATARSAGAEVPFLRPPALAGDTVHSVHAVLHALDWLEASEGEVPDTVVMLLPTSPLRTAADIDFAIKILQRDSPPSVISVMAVSPQGSLRRLRNGRLVPLVGEGERNFQRQDVEALYAVNGSIYVAATTALRDHRSFHIDGAVGYVMAKRHSIDINTAEDFAMAEALAPLRDEEF